MLKTIVSSRELLASQIGLSYSGLANRLPRNFYGQTVLGMSGKKEYHIAAQHHYRFQTLLSASPRLSSVAVNRLMKERQVDFDRSRDKWSHLMTQFLQKHPSLDPYIEAYPLADLELLGRVTSALPCLIPRYNEKIYLDDGPEWGPYLRNLSVLLDQMEEDVNLLLDHFNSVIGTRPDLPFEPELQLARQAIHEHMGSAPQTGIPFSQATVLPFVSQVHFSNTPYLWADILTAMGHVDVQVVDRSGDGNRDVESKFNGSPRFSQIKSVSFPIGEEIIRQFANTCRTYGVSDGYFVTTLRFAKDASLGQWPQLPVERKAELRNMYSSNSLYRSKMVDEICKQPRIANIELIDGETLAAYAYKYRIGALPDGKVDRTYWSSLTIPGFRKSDGKPPCQ
ncbi:restriction endonuclease [Effusibacillus pohliae]|uniref:restriction endonuclease n=1 Tax=Effusibacillus pohliae TaxID=232270 RepID=UPI0003769444|nr:restriction endonuclease [Effusibacillus pohliae]